MDTKADLEDLYRKLRRSKFVIFSIVGFLILLTYLLIVVSKQIGSPEAQINTASRANKDSTLSPQYALPSCNNYEDYFSGRRNLIHSMLKDLGCPPFGAIKYPPDPLYCLQLASLIGTLNESEDFFRLACNSCPIPSPTPDFIYPTKPYLTITPWPTYPYNPSPSPIWRGYPTNTPVPLPKLTVYPIATPTRYIGPYPT